MQSIEVDLQLDNPNLAQDNLIITRSNEMENATRQHRNLDSSTTSDDTRSNNMPTSVFIQVTSQVQDNHYFKSPKYTRLQ